MMLFHKIFAVSAFVATFAAVHASTADATRPFELYKPIVDKCLFGPPPEDPTVMPENSSVSDKGQGQGERELAKEQERLEKAVSVSALIQKPNGVVMVGFSDSSEGKTPAHYYLAVGESKGGWLVKTADITAKTVLLEKDGLEIDCRLGDKSAQASVDKAGDQKSTLPVRSSLLGRSPRPVPGERTLMSRKARRLQEERAERDASARREEARKKAEAEVALRLEQEKAEREADKLERTRLMEALHNAVEEKRRGDGRPNVDGPVSGGKL